jgi:hypothetical protein
MASIEQIKGLISSKGGVARSNLFAVELPSIAGVTSRDINLLCRDVNLPGRQIVSYDKEIGTKREKVAYGAISDDLSMTFLLLNDYGIKRYFETWQSLAFDPQTYQIGYKSSYAFDNIKIHQLRKGVSLPVYSTPLGIPKLPPLIQNRLPRVGPFDLAQGEFDLDFLTKDKNVYTCTLYGAWPVTIEAIPLNNELDGLTELRVQLAYTRWTSNFTEATPVTDFVQTALGTAITRVFN